AHDERREHAGASCIREGGVSHRSPVRSERARTMSSDAARPALNDVLRDAGDVVLGLASPNDFTEVRRLIEAGLAWRWGSFDPLRNRDLIEFAATYGPFPIVVAKSPDGPI